MRVEPMPPTARPVRASTPRAMPTVLEEPADRRALLGCGRDPALHTSTVMISGA